MSSQITGGESNRRLAGSHYSQGGGCVTGLLRSGSSREACHIVAHLEADTHTEKKEEQKLWSLLPTALQSSASTSHTEFSWKPANAGESLDQRALPEFPRL